MPANDHYSAYLLLCVALGALRIAQGIRWRVAQHARLSQLWHGLDAGWAVVSVLVASQAPSSVVQGTAIWFVLGALAGWLLLRLATSDASTAKAVTAGAAQVQGSRTYAPSQPGLELPDWYQEYLLCFGVGLLVFASAALIRFPLFADFHFLTYVSSPAGACWMFLVAITLARIGLHCAGSFVQRSMDRGVRGGLEVHPLCRELFGDIRRVICKPEETARLTGDDVYVYRVVGSRAAGVVVAEFRPVDQTLSELVQGLVYMDSGARQSLNAGSARTLVPPSLTPAPELQTAS